MTTTTASKQPAPDEQIDAKRRAVLATIGLAIGLASMTIFAVAYIGALHDPTPHNVRVGVVGTVPPAIEKAFAGTLSFHPQPSTAALLDAIHARTVSGGISGRTAYVASGESYANAAFLTALFTGRFPNVKVVETAPLQRGDPRGLSLFYLVVALTFGGYFGATVVSTLLGTGPRSHRRALARTGALAGYSVLAGIAAALVIDTAFGAVTGHFWSIAAIAMLLSFTVAVATTALQSVLGIVGTLVAMVVFIMFGASSSGGAYPTDFTPALWRAIGPYLPAGAALSALKGSVYFGNDNIGGRLGLLAIYAAISAVVSIAIGWRRGMSAPELELAAGASI